LIAAIEQLSDELEANSSGRTDNAPRGHGVVDGQGLGSAHGNEKGFKLQKGEMCFRTRNSTGKITTHIEMATGKMENRVMKCV
jgi:hypothetical protein